MRLSGQDKNDVEEKNFINELANQEDFQKMMQEFL